MVNYSIKGYSGGLATLIGATLSGVTIKEFTDGVFTRALDGSVLDGALSIAIILFGVAIILLVKDMFDGGNWSYREKKNAMQGFGIGILLILASYYGAAYVGTTTTALPQEDQFNTAGTAVAGYNTYSGGTAGENAASVVSEQYVVLGAAPTYTDHTSLTIFFNQTGFVDNFIRTLRGFNITLSDDGITSAKFQYYNKDGSAMTTLLDSADDEITITDKGAYSIINATFTLPTVLGWIASHTYDNIQDFYRLQLVFDTDYSEAADLTMTWTWIVANDADMYYYLVLFLMTIGFAYPFVKLLDLTNAPRRPMRRRRRPYRRSRRRY